MKSYILTLLIPASLLLASCEKEDHNSLRPRDVPQNVQDAFNAKYPNAKKVSWEKEGANFEAEMDGDPEVTVILNNEGTILATETEIETSALPQSAIDYLKAIDSKEDIEEAEKVETNAGENVVITFEAEFDDAEYVFDQNGKFISAEVEVEDED